MVNAGIFLLGRELPNPSFDLSAKAAVFRRRRSHITLATAAKLGGRVESGDDGEDDVCPTRTVLE
jgi:hypothetical protein